MNECLKQIWGDYLDAVYAYAVLKFEKVVLPWLEEKGYDFLAGNGEWYVESVSWYINPNIPKEILNILQTEVPGLPANDLGSLMPSYKHSEK